MKAKSPLRLGYFGAGFNANFHAEALRHVRNVEVGAVFAPQGTSDFAKHCHELRIGEPTICATEKELCESVDVVVISAPNFERLGIMQAIEQHGKNLAGVLCEKPLARTVAEARAMQKLAKNFHTGYLENQIHMRLVRNGRLRLAAYEKEMGWPYIVRSAEEHGGAHSNWFWDAILGIIDIFGT